MRILVSGAAGFIGSHLCEKILENPENQVIGIDNFFDYYSRKLKENNLSSLRNNDRFQLIEGSILDLERLKQINDIDVVYHYAAIAGVRYSIKNPIPYFKINYMGTANMLEAFKNVKKFVFASSSSVYGSLPLEELPVKENHKLSSKCPYPLSKIHGEELCEQYMSLYSLPVTMLRFYTVYGARQRPDEMFTKFIMKILKGEQINVYGDGEQTRDFTHVSDIVNGSILAQKKGSGVYNLGSGRRISVNDSISLMSKLISKEPLLNHTPRREEEALHTHADITKAKSELGYSPKISFETGVKDCIDWCRSVLEKGLF